MCPRGLPSSASPWGTDYEIYLKGQGRGPIILFAGFHSPMRGRSAETTIW